MENGSAPATKKDLTDLESRLDGKLANLESRVEGKIDAVEQRVLDKVGELIRDSETKLLNAFYGFAETNQKRFSSIEIEHTALKSRVTTLEERIMIVEKRLNAPE